METVVIIGGGASGMMAALAASERAHVVLLERQQRLGRKLLSTGNGRCNLSNLNAAPAHYHGEDAAFCSYALSRFTPEDTLAFFRSLGLITVTEPSGRVYPLSDSANSVLDVLRFALERAGVELHTGCCVTSISRKGRGFSVESENEHFFADKLIIACGGAAGAKLGGVRDGYDFLKAMGHKRTKLYPALVQLLTEGDFTRALKGVRADAAVRLLQYGEEIAASRGEVQFTEKGISGPASFDISRAASTCGGGAEIHLNFLRDESFASVFALLRERREALPTLEAGESFTGMLHNRLGRMLVKAAGTPGTATLGSLSDGELKKLVRTATDFVLPLRGTESFDQAQVTAGGTSTALFDPQTLESKLVPGLFACGEVLDIDGDCGGFNLQWAWASGRLAGRLGT